MGGYADGSLATSKCNSLSAPGVFTSLSAPGLLDDIHLQPKYGNSLFLEDVAFYPRVSTFFGGELWLQRGRYIVGW